MIVKTFDQGWGTQWGWKQFELDIVESMLANIAKDSSRTVVINSVWYTDKVHNTVMSWLKYHDWDQIVLVAMLDAAIPKPEFYAEFNRPVLTLGYYPGPNFIDLCAVFLHKNINLAKYGDLSDTTRIDTAYMCLNRKPHWHRRKFYRQLESMSLLDHGMVSMGDDSGKPLRVIPGDQDSDFVAPNSETHHYGIPNNVCDLGPVDNWHRCFFNVVTETVYGINDYYFVSEKIYKPILGERPFAVYDTDGATNWLESRGFETYYRDFQDISDQDPGNPTQLAWFIRDLSAQPFTYFRAKLTALQEKIQHNKNNLEIYIKHQDSILSRGMEVDSVF
jgi:hypothetical protein